MLEIHYLTSKIDSQENIKIYGTPSEFVANQYKEVPDLQDYFITTKVLIDGKSIDMEDKTIFGLFHYLKS